MQPSLRSTLPSSGEPGPRKPMGAERVIMIALSLELRCRLFNVLRNFTFNWRTRTRTYEVCTKHATRHDARDRVNVSRFLGCRATPELRILCPPSESRRKMTSPWHQIETVSPILLRSRVSYPSFESRLSPLPVVHELKWYEQRCRGLALRPRVRRQRGVR
jgi:hypothetical protein